jgi:hypothetical protein
VLIAVALGITVFVYGLVAGIVRMDDVGGWLMARSSSAAKAMGRGLIAFTPWLMRGLSIVGTAAMFMVGGSLLVHGIKPVEHWIEQVIVPTGGIVAALGPVLVHVLVGASLAVRLWCAWSCGTSCDQPGWLIRSDEYHHWWRKFLRFISILGGRGLWATSAFSLRCWCAG